MSLACQCGCGGTPKEGRRFIFGHHLKMVEVRKPRGPNKKRKYRKKDQKYWHHKRDNTKITSYAYNIEALQDELTKIQAVLAVDNNRIDSVDKRINALEKFFLAWTEAVASSTGIVQKYD